MEPILNDITVSNNVAINREAIIKRLLHTIEEQSNLLSQFEFGKLISIVHNNAKSLLSNDISASRDVRGKLAGLMLLDCLLEVNLNDDIAAERRLDISRMLQTLLKSGSRGSFEATEKLLRAITRCVGHLAHVAIPTELETLTLDFVNLALDLIRDLKSETNRFIGVLLMNEFAINAPHFMFQKKHLLAELWVRDILKDLWLRLEKESYILIFS